MNVSKHKKYFKIRFSTPSRYKISVFILHREGQSQTVTFELQLRLPAPTKVGFEEQRRR